MSNFDKRYCIRTFVAIVIVFIIIHLIGWNSDAMKEARKFITENEVIRANIGEIRGIYMLPFSSNIKRVGQEGDAHVQLLLAGTKGKYSQVKVSLTVKNEIWHVNSAIASVNHMDVKIK
jgi:hypothetical protein